MTGLIFYITHDCMISSICNALMMITGVIEMFAICRLYLFHSSAHAIFKKSYGRRAFIKKALCLLHGFPTFF